jgi:hypothetical protein
MSKTPQTAEAAQSLFQRNMKLFQEKLPTCYEALKNTELEHLTLDFKSPGKIDVYDNRSKKWLYDGDAVGWADIETSNYIKSAYSKDALYTVDPHDMRASPRYRYATQHLTSFYDACPKFTPNCKYSHPGFFSAVLMTGVGLGLHIRDLINKQLVQCLIIHEEDHELMLASMYITDWNEIISPFLTFGRSITISLNKVDNQEARYGVLWNSIYYFVPDFPLSMFYYNHQGKAENKLAIKKIQTNAQAHVGTWGYYDDEVNQYVNAVNNLKNKVKPIKKVDYSVFENIAIVGSGPSLDTRIEDLEHLKGRVPIVSCGTALQALYKHNIIPDIHVELESDLRTYQVLKNIPSEFLKEVHLICAAQINPNIPSLFKDENIFFKDSTALSELFSLPEDIIEKATPTCTNAALGLGVYWGVRNIYTFGIDFGFKNKKIHHSKNTVFYDSDTVEKLKLDPRIHNLREIDDVFGSKILTKPTYFTAFISFSDGVFLANRVHGINILSCSEGAKIDNTLLTNSEDLRSRTQDLTFNGISIPHHPPKNNDDLIKAEKLFQSSLTSMTNSIIALTKNGEFNNIEEFYLLIHAISRQVFNFLKLHGNIYFTLRGSIWHYIYAGTAMVLKQTNLSDQKKVISLWLEFLTDFLENIPLHFSTIIKRSRSENNKWLKHGIDTIEGGESFSTKLTKIDYEKLL